MAVDTFDDKQHQLSGKLTQFLLNNFSDKAQIQLNSSYKPGSCRVEAEIISREELHKSPNPIMYNSPNNPMIQKDKEDMEMK